MVSNKKRIKYVLATIAATSAKTKEGALQPAVGVKVDSIGNGVEEFEGLGARRLMDEEQKGLLAALWQPFVKIFLKQAETYYAYSFKRVLKHGLYRR